MSKSFLIIVFIFSTFLLVSAQSCNENKTSYDKKLAEKYGLKIHETKNHYSPAPEWFRELDMITHRIWYNIKKKNVWKGYGAILKDTLIERTVRFRADYQKLKSNENKIVVIDGNFNVAPVEGVKLISHVPHSKKAFEQAHKKGVKVIPYLHFKDIHTQYDDQDVYYFQHPEILLRDKDKHWVHLPMDGTERLFRLSTCANSPSYWKLSLAYIKKIMDWGADGIFIDNVNRYRECFGNGIRERSLEFNSYVHEHLFPDSSQAYAFNRFLEEVRLLVKSYGNDKIVVLNSFNDDFIKTADGCLWESFIYGWSSVNRRPGSSWSDIKKKVKDKEWFTKEGHKLITLSYFNRKAKKLKDNVFWAYSSAKLLDMIFWSDLIGTGAEILYKMHLGKTLQPLKEVDNWAYRIFENGIILLNNSNKDKTITIDLPKDLQQNFYYDLFNNKKRLKVIKSKITVTVPKQCARVYSYKKLI